jgi:hypothetical protein
MKQKKSKTAQHSKPAGEPVYRYISACCSVQGNKPALLKTPEAEGTLGSWRCSGCGKRCKVSVHDGVKKTKETANVA